MSSRLASRHLPALLLSLVVALMTFASSRARGDCAKVAKQIDDARSAMAMSCAELEQARRALRSCKSEQMAGARAEVDEAFRSKRCACDKVRPTDVLRDVRRLPLAASTEQWAKLLTQVEESDRCSRQRKAEARRVLVERIGTSPICNDGLADAVSKLQADIATPKLNCSQAVELRDVAKVLRLCPSSPAELTSAQAAIATHVATACEDDDDSDVTFRLVETASRELRACNACTPEQRQALEHRQMRYLATHLMGIIRRPWSDEERKRTSSLLSGVGGTVIDLDELQRQTFLRTVGADPDMLERLIALATSISARAAEIIKGLPKDDNLVEQVLKAVEEMNAEERRFFFTSAGVLSSEKDAVRAQAVAQKHPRTMQVFISPPRGKTCGSFETFYSHVERWLTELAGISKPIELEASQYNAVVQQAIADRAKLCGVRSASAADHSCGAVLGISLSEQPDGTATGLAKLSLIVPAVGASGRKTREIATVPIPSFRAGCAEQGDQKRAARELEMGIAEGFSMLHTLPGIEYTAPAEVYQNPACGISVRTDITPKRFELKSGQGLSVPKEDVDSHVLRGVQDALHVDINAKLIGEIRVGTPNDGVRPALVFDGAPGKYTATLKVADESVYSVAALLKDAEQCGISAADLRYGAGQALGNRVAGILIGAALSTTRIPAGEADATSSASRSALESPWLWGTASVAFALVGSALVLSAVESENDAIRNDGESDDANARMAVGLSFLLGSVAFGATGVAIDAF